MTSRPSLPAPLPSSGSLLHPSQSAPTFGQTLKEGFGFGAGAAVARNVVDRMFSGGTVAPVAPTVSAVPLEKDLCKDSFLRVQECYKTSNGDSGLCSGELSAYMKCKDKE